MIIKGYVTHIGNKSTVYDMECDTCGHQERMQVFHGVDPICSACIKNERKNIFICSKCNMHGDSYENEYPNLCVSCGSIKALDLWWQEVQVELTLFNKRNNKEYDFDEFCQMCFEGYVSDEEVSGLNNLAYSRGVEIARKLEYEANSHHKRV